MRIILYLGKGGVGKTTTAAATALRSAQLGYKTLVASTDIAHSLADSLDIDLSHKPVRVAENLWAQNQRHCRYGRILGCLAGICRRICSVDKGLDRVMADELSAIPGMDEIVALLHINKQAKDADFDRVIIDAAPTGETIRL